MILKYIRILMLTFIVVEGVAPLSASARIYTTWGESSCADWMSERNNDILRGGNIRWIEGYMSALNVMAGGKDALADIDVELLVDWFNLYCSKNPKMRLSDGAAELVLKLKKR